MDHHNTEQCLGTYCPENKKSATIAPIQTKTTKHTSIEKSINKSEAEAKRKTTVLTQRTAEKVQEREK